KKLDAEQLKKFQKKIKKTGLVYISSIPPYMKPSKMRQILSRFGKIDRLFLKPENPRFHTKRVKYGGNKKKKYVEGWCEFLNKRNAKLCCETLNAQIIGGKKNSYYHDDILNIKYLKGFKWNDLIQQISKENDLKQSKLQLEMYKANKQNKNFINNIEKSKTLNLIKEKKLKKLKSNIRRNFRQKDVATKRADETSSKIKKAKVDKNLSNVLTKIF
ncbi:RNA-binding ATPase activator ESF2 ASCRUDRAFT_17671, partial [Ascoidea rubescens DSM 1968]